MGSLESSASEFSAAISDAASMNSSLAARERVTRMQIDVLYTIHKNCWRKAVINENGGSQNTDDWLCEPSSQECSLLTEARRSKWRWISVA